MTTDPSVQRRQLTDEEPSNSSFAIERAIDRNRAFAILFINGLLVPRILREIEEFWFLYFRNPLSIRAVEFLKRVHKRANEKNSGKTLKQIRD